MRGFLALSIFAACGGSDGVDGLAPPTCQPDSMLRYVHDLGGTEVTGELQPGNYAFINKLSDDEPGYLQVGEVGGAGDGIRVEFERLIARGSSTNASGVFQIGTLAAGNCETELPSRITALSDEGWTVQLVELHMAPYCGGPAVEGSFAACLIPEPF